MKKKIIKFFFILGIFFWCAMMISAITKLVGYNEILNLFDFNTVLTKDYKVDTLTDKKSVIITYQYTVNLKTYNKKLEVYDKYFEDKFKLGVEDSLIIFYNRLFPELSYIKSLPLEQRKNKVGVIISLVFIIFLIIIFFLSGAGSNPNSRRA